MRLYGVDAFTDAPFRGNPAAVCLLEKAAGAGWMQDVAREMNLSETAFVEPRDGAFGLRWFTPAVEVDLCGHATLASAHVLLEEGIALDGAPIRFETRSGALVCSRSGAGIEMDFPARPVVPADPPPGLLEAVGAEPVWCGRSEIGYVLELASEGEVRALRPDFAALRAIPGAWTCVTAAASTDGFDFVSRFFAPQAGIDEDPVTGSAHCALAHLWSERTGRTSFRAYQCSERGGVVDCELRGDRVALGGRAVTVFRGELV